MWASRQGRPPTPESTAWKASHALHVRLARLIAAAQAQEEELEGLSEGWPAEWSPQGRPEVDGALWSSDR